MSAHDVSAFQWTECGWSCDCNRAYAFSTENQLAGYCGGQKRYVAIDFHGDLEGWTVDELRKEANRGYYWKLQQPTVASPEPPSP